jgi:hypothetical protein
VGNAKLTLHQDLSAGIRRQHRELDEVKKYSIDEASLGDSNIQTSSGFFTKEPCDTSKLPKRQNVFFFKDKPVQ